MNTRLQLASANNEARTLLPGLPEQLAATMGPLRTMLADLISTTAYTFGKLSHPQRICSALAQPSRVC
jgi:hypothetical protein